MIDVSLSGLLVALAKAAALGVAGLFAAMFILWPVGEQKTTRGQWVTFYIVMSLMTDMMFFGIIRWQP